MQRVRSGSLSLPATELFGDPSSSSFGSSFSSSASTSGATVQRLTHSPTSDFGLSEAGGTVQRFRSGSLNHRPTATSSTSSSSTATMDMGSSSVSKGLTADSTNARPVSRSAPPNPSANLMHPPRSHSPSFSPFAPPDESSDSDEGGITMMPPQYMRRKRTSSAPREVDLQAIMPTPTHMLKKNHVHHTRPSLLSSFYREDLFHIEEQDIPQTSYRGLLNLSLICLVLNNIRLMFENMRQYGLLVDFTLITKDMNPRSWPSVISVMFLGVCMLNALFIEKLAHQLMLIYVQETLKAGKQMPVADRTAQINSMEWPVSLKVIFPLQVMNMIAAAGVPMLMIHKFQPNPLANVIVLLICVTVLAKLWSYGSVHRYLRFQYFYRGGLNPNKARKELSYPDNLEAGDVLYFFCAPTLIYETHFPRSPTIRYSFLVKRIVELFLLAIVQYAVAMQYMLPLLQNTLKVYGEFDLLHLIERIIKLSVPNLFIWLLGFYMFFHLFLNIVSEILRFGDRMFYRDWWNCTSLSYFWRTWNLPVHNWFMLHVYLPLVSRGYSKVSASLVIFFISAVFHEFVVSVAFQTRSLFAFAGMMFQIVAITLSAPMRGKQLGNVFFWLTIMLGQPLIVLMYFVDYMHKHHVNV